MADSADGVAGTIGLILTASLLAAAKLADVTPPPALPLWPRACSRSFLQLSLSGKARGKAFMGDSGALMVGAILAGSALQLVADHRGETAPIPRSSSLPAGAPVFDCLRLGQRLSKSRPMSPDRDHLHHIFERAGFGKRSTVLAIAAYLIVNATVALGLWRLGLPQLALTALFLTAFALQTRFMLHGWRAAKWLRGKTQGEPAEDTANVVELDRVAS